MLYIYNNIVLKIIKIKNNLDEVVEKTKAHIVYLMSFSENRVTYKIMEKTMVQPDRPQMIM